jgi:Tol biopolymer transport system component
MLEDKAVVELSLGRHLVYTAENPTEPDIYYAEIPLPGRPAASPRRLVYSTRADQQPAFSPDGKQIAFVSQRTGRRELWVANADGSNPQQRTDLGAVFAPTWSPDGLHIVFHGRIAGQPRADVFTVPAAGGAMNRLTTHPADDALASYSRDGRWIYFGSSRTEKGGIWKMPAEGGEATQVTVGGMLPAESPDGRTLFYAHRDAEKGIWKMPVQGGEAVQVTGPVPPNPAFTVSADGIYYKTSRQGVIEFLDFSTGKSHPVVVSDAGIGMGLSLSSDGRFLMFTQVGPLASDLMLIKDFSLP